MFIFVFACTQKPYGGVFNCFNTSGEWYTSNGGAPKNVYPYPIQSNPIIKGKKGSGVAEQFQLLGGAPKTYFVGVH